MASEGGRSQLPAWKHTKAWRGRSEGHVAFAEPSAGSYWCCCLLGEDRAADADDRRALLDRDRVVVGHAHGEVGQIQLGVRPAEVVAGLLGDLANERVAVGNQLWSAFLLRIQAEVGGGQWIEAGPLLRELRMIKDEAELAALSEAARLTDEAWEEFIVAGPLSGQTERQALHRLTELTEQRGLRDLWGICASGPLSASPHHATSDRTIADGDTVIFDWGGTIDGYYSDVTRTVHVGEPDDEFRAVYDLVRAANQATLEAVRPGVACGELDRTARAMFEEAGHGEAFLHRVGHGLGLEVHEEPYLVGGNELPLAAGMVFSDEPGLYFEGRFGVRIEDTVVCTTEGGRRLNEATRDLVVMR